MMTRIKICAMTNIENALAAAQLGADAVGFICYEKSPRFVTPEKAREIVAALPPFVTTVGVFVNPSHELVENYLAQVPFDLLQFHGQESPEECRQYHKPYIKAIHMTPDIDLFAICKKYHDAKGLLLETSKAGKVGGTGETFDWNLIPKTLPKPIILAGGLTPENVAAAIQQVHPYAVDVTSGIEASPGVKDPQKMQKFILECRGAPCGCPPNLAP